MSSPIVSIENCTASQLVGDQTFKIAHGTLSLERLSGGVVPDDKNGSLLLLKIDESSFALTVERDAIVGTRGDRSYLFSKRLPPTATAPKSPAPVTSPGAGEGDLKEIPLQESASQSNKDDAAETILLVQIDMPASASESDLTKFEKVLVDDKFLLTGPQADADNLSRAFLEWTGIKTKDLRSITAQNTKGDGTKDPTRFSDTTHSVAGGAASGSTTFSETTTKVGQTINAGMASLGSFIGAKIGTTGLFSSEAEPAGWKRDTKEAVEDGVETVGIVGSGLADGVKHAGGEISDATSKLVEHNYGEDARKVKEQVGTTLQNAASVGGTAMEHSSVVVAGVTVGKGAVQEEEKEKEKAQRP